MLPRAFTGTGTGHHLRFAYTHWQLTTCRSLFVSLNPYEEESRRDNSPNPSFTSHPEPVNSEEIATSDSPRRNTTQIQTKKGSRTRQTRTLRPLVIPPTFPPTLIPVTPTLEQEETTKTEPSVTVSLTHLPSHTVKADIRPVFQRFGEVKRIVIAPGGTCADVIFTDAREVKRTLRAYADKPLFVRGREIVVFRKHTSEATVGYYDNNDGQATTPQPNIFYSSRSGLSNQGDRHGVIFVSNFPPDTTQEELQEALAQFGKYERFVMRPGSKYAYFMYSTDYPVDHILHVHSRVPITVRGLTLRLERSTNRPYSFSPDPSEQAPELGKPFDPATSQAIVEELKQTVPRWKGSYEPSRVLWIGRLPSEMSRTAISRTALTNFWSRLGCVVDVRLSIYGFAHVEFASTEDALRAARQGAHRGFRYGDRLLDVDFAPWVFHIGSTYRIVYISGWPGSRTRSELLHWAYDIPNIASGTVLPPFRGAERSDPRGAYLHFPYIDDARQALKKLDGRTGPNGEELHIALSRLPAVHPSRLWRWVCAEEGMRGRGEWEDKEEGYFEVEWSGLGFGTGAEGNDTALELGSGSGSGVSSTSRSPVGTRGGRTSWKVSDQQANAEAASSVLVIGPRHRHHGMTSEVWKDDEVEEALRDSPPKLVEQSDTSPPPPPPTTTTLSQRLLARMDSEGQDSDDSPRLLG